MCLPCIHKRKEEIGELFHEHLGTEKGLSDPTQLTRVARKHLRNVFMTRRAALTGVNFAVAETGEYVVCTNEGNADMGAHLSEVQIASMGLEKIIPQKKHLGIFLRLLARSATGQPITIYSSHYKKPREGQEMHLILVNAGRTRQLGRTGFSKLAEMHQVRSLHEYLSGVPQKRRTELPQYHFRADWRDSGSQIWI